MAESPVFACKTGPLKVILQDLNNLDGDEVDKAVVLGDFDDGNDKKKSELCSKTV
jgi:hypothetical protein